MSRPDQPYEPEPTRYDENQLSHNAVTLKRGPKPKPTLAGLNENQAGCMKFLWERGQSGVVDNHGRVLARGEIHGYSETAQCWLQLVARGYISGAAGRISFTSSGNDWCWINLGPPSE